jgi:predicted nuclease of predicted toxin-antitoxin system
MRFKLDENLPTELAQALELSGHDADTVKDEGLEGKPDSVIVATALKAARVLLTLDKGIADVGRYPKGAHAGVVLFRPGSSGRGVVAAFVRDHLPELLERKLEGFLCVVTPTGIRVR